MRGRDWKNLTLVRISESAVEWRGDFSGRNSNILIGEGVSLFNNKSTGLELRSKKGGERTARGFLVRQLEKKTIWF